MGKVKKEKSIENLSKDSGNLTFQKLKLEDSNNSKRTKSSSSFKNNFRKKDIGNVIKSEYHFISNLFEILELSKLNQGRRTESEDDDSESMQLDDIPEQKVFKKEGQKKSTTQSSVKNKSFPQTIEGLEKELEGLKGTPMTYQKKLRKKGLQSRLIKKKKKEQLKLKKIALKATKKRINGFSKTKPILNSDGNVVSNKFDFADTDIKKDSKRKPVTTNNETINTVNDSSGSAREKIKNSFKSDSNKNDSKYNSQVKKERDSLESIKHASNNDVKSTSSQGPVFNKDNKMVFSKVYMPENHKKHTKKSDRDPKKILKKLKEDNKKLSELEKEDQDKAASLKEKNKWAAALKRASGEKVRDDPELLRKSIAREKNKKMRSQKKWKARIDHVEKEKEEKQKKRKENIQSRKSEKKKKKMKKAIKKGSYIPL